MKAIDLFMQAADRGYANGQDSLGWMYEHGRGVTQDYSKALAWYQKAADQGFDKSKKNIEALKAKGI
jgi:TPR repeat protein